MGDHALLDTLQYRRVERRADLPGRLGQGWPRVRGRQRRALELDHVAVGIGDVQRGPVPLGAEVDRQRAARGQPVRRQVRPQGGLVEGVDAQAQVVQVAPAALRWRVFAAERAGDVDEVDQRVARTQVHEAELGAQPQRRAAQHLTVEGHAAFEIAHAQHDMVEAVDSEWRHRCGGVARKSAAADAATAKLPIGRMRTTGQACVR